MSDASLRSLFEAGVEYDDIAAINERQEGWRPSRSGVMRKLERVVDPEQFPLRRRSHKNLIPWKIRPEHSSHRFRYMLQAESRRRVGAELSVTDKKLLSMLNRLLSGGGGKPMVIAYDETNGFYLTDRTEGDTDIIRQPKERLSRPGRHPTSAP